MHLLKRFTIQLSVALFMIVALFGTPEALESNATPLQSLYMIKQLLPDVKTVGLMLKQSDENTPDLMNQVKRASASLGVKIVVADVEALPDVAAQFRDLTDSYHIQALWIIRDMDVLTGSIARSYLIKNSTLRGIPLFAPSTDWVSAGACAAVVTDGGNTKLFVNQKTLNALGLKVPEKYASVTQVLATN
jgi:ABC-type uncharacterized transport system substrate-binding protein